MLGIYRPVPNRGHKEAKASAKDIGLVPKMSRINQWLDQSEHFSVISSDGVEGIVEEVLRTTEGDVTHLEIAVPRGWWRLERVRVPAAAVTEISPTARRLAIDLPLEYLFEEGPKRRRFWGRLVRPSK